MKVKNALKLPFTLLADVATLGNFGEGSYTGDVIYRDKIERKNDKDLETLERIANIVNKMK